jgi:hypothetical protein
MKTAVFSTTLTQSFLAAANVNASHQFLRRKEATTPRNWPKVTPPLRVRQ